VALPFKPSVSALANNLDQNELWSNPLFGF